VTFFKLAEARSGLLGGIHMPFESPAVPLTSLALDNVWANMNRSDSGEVATVDTALGLPSFWRCIGLMSTVLSTCDLDAFERIRTPEGPRRKTQIYPNILDDLNPDTTYTLFEWRELAAIHVLCWGDAFIRKIRGFGPDGKKGSGKVVDLVPIHPSRVTPKLDTEGNKIFEVLRLDKHGNLVATEPPLILTTWEVMHIPGMGYDGIKGLPVIEYMKRLVGSGIAADKLAAKFYRSGTMLSGVIKVKAPLANQAQADAIRSRWQQKMAGVDHAGETAILDSESEFQPLTIPPESLQFIESRRWQKTEMASWFGIPPHLIGDVEKSTSWGTGIETQNVGFVEFTLKGWTRRFESRYSRELLPGRQQYCEHNLRHLLRGTQLERFQAYSFAMQGNWILRNEIRAWEGMEPVEGMDEPLTSTNNFTPGVNPVPPAPAGPSGGSGNGN
jgi:HK97 family phage portal protein